MSAQDFNYLSVPHGTKNNLSPCKGIRILKPGNFRFWNPESWTLESEIQLKESGLLPTIGVRNTIPLTENSESRAWNPESQNVLDSLTYGAILITDFVFRTLEWPKTAAYIDNKDNKEIHSVLRVHYIGLDISPCTSDGKIYKHLLLKVESSDWWQKCNVAVVLTTFNRDRYF